MPGNNIRENVTGWREVKKMDMKELEQSVEKLGRKLAGKSADWQYEAMKHTVRVG